MTKRSFSIAFKKEVIAYVENGNSCYKASKFFSERDGVIYSQSMFQQWYRNREKINEQTATMKRIGGGGRKTTLGTLEEILYDEIIFLRTMKNKVTRTHIAERAQILGRENNIEIKATGRWISGFMSRYSLSLRRTTNFTTLEDNVLLSRAVNYMKHLHQKIKSLDLSKVLMMDETAVYFEDPRTQTVDLKGRKHVIMKSTGFSSMRITAAMGVWADGRKATPLIIHKGNSLKEIKKVGSIITVTQKKAWVDQQLIIAYINMMFPVFDNSNKKAIIWDSCKAHISKKVKDHCIARKIELIVIPGGLTPYLQAGDIGIFRELKDKIASLINFWKHSDAVVYTKYGNPKPPSHAIVNSWIEEAWKNVSQNNIKNSIFSAGISNNIMDWHISKHEVYGKRFVEEYNEAVFEGAAVDALEEFEELSLFDIADE